MGRSRFRNEYPVSGHSFLKGLATSPVTRLLYYLVQRIGVGNLSTESWRSSTPQVRTLTLGSGVNAHSHRQERSPARRVHSLIAAKLIAA